MDCKKYKLKRVKQKIKINIIKKSSEKLIKFLKFKRIIKNKQTLQIVRDPIYKSSLINLLINHFMRNGNKTQAEKIVYNSFKHLKWNFKRRPFFIYNEIIEQAKPVFQLVPKRVGKIRRYIPFPLPSDKRIKKTVFWLKNIIKNRKEKSIYDRFIKEFNDIALNKRTQLFVYKEDIQKQVIQNRAYLHFRWK